MTFALAHPAPTESSERPALATDVAYWLMTCDGVESPVDVAADIIAGLLSESSATRAATVALVQRGIQETRR